MMRLLDAVRAAAVTACCAGALAACGDDDEPPRGDAGASDADTGSAVSDGGMDASSDAGAAADADAGQGREGGAPAWIEPVIAERPDAERLAAGGGHDVASGSWVIGPGPVISCGGAMWSAHSTTDCGQDSDDPRTNYGARVSRWPTGAEPAAADVETACEPGTEGSTNLSIACSDGRVALCLQTHWNPSPEEIHYQVRCGLLGDRPGGYRHVLDLGWPLEAVLGAWEGGFAVHAAQIETDDPHHRLVVADAALEVTLDADLGVWSSNPQVAPQLVGNEWWLPLLGGAEAPPEVVRVARDGRVQGTLPLVGLAPGQLEGLAVHGLADGLGMLLQLASLEGTDLVLARLRADGSLEGRRVAAVPAGTRVSLAGLHRYGSGWVVVFLRVPPEADASIVLVRTDDDGYLLEPPATLLAAPGVDVARAGLSAETREAWVVYRVKTGDTSADVRLLRALLPPPPG